MTTYQEISAQFYSNRLLFGDPADPGVVAVEIASKTEIDVYRRVQGKLARERRPLRLFALVEDIALLEGFRPAHETRALDGNFRYRVLVTFGSIDALENDRRARGEDPCLAGHRSKDDVAKEFIRAILANYADKGDLPASMLIEDVYRKRCKLPN